MRLVTSLFVGAALLAGAASLPAYAAPLTDQSRDIANPSVEQVAAHCGPHSHYVHSHHNHEGHFIRGHCVHNH